MILSIDHVQISIPAGRLEEALAFYVDLLGFTQVPKPAEMSPSGAWLTAGTVNLHLGEDADVFVASAHAHPALRVDNFQALMRAAEHKCLKTRMDTGPSGFVRGSIWDPFGNRIEIIEAHH